MTTCQIDLNQYQRNSRGASAAWWNDAARSTGLISVNIGQPGGGLGSVSMTGALWAQPVGLFFISVQGMWLAISVDISRNARPKHAQDKSGGEYVQAMSQWVC
jgi:hypothetical protein